MTDEVTNGEIVRRLEDLSKDVRAMSGTFVRTELYESQRQDAGRRVGEIEKDVVENKTEFNAFKLLSDQRYRNTVNMFIMGGIGFAGSVGLYLLQLVAK